MHPLASAGATVQVTENGWYQISTSDVVAAAPSRTMPGRSYPTLDFHKGDVIVDTGNTDGVVDIAVEEWGAEPALHIPGSGGFAEVVEESVPFEAARLRILAADGSQLLALDLAGGIGNYRLRLYSRYLNPRRQRHLLRLWPAPAAPMWDYHLDEDGRPMERPDRTTTETLTVVLSAEQADTLWNEVNEMALNEVTNGDVDDIVEDCHRICDIIPARNDRAQQAALTVRQWKVALAVLEHRNTFFDEVDPDDDPDAADAAATMRRTRKAIISQIGDRLPAGRVLGL
ncbi:hypothetical protein ACH35V_00245 [Actinomadura sp. 1N219]|uniref:hypothetical protein n=1 Tax=Actinomadura sp. 1N219 TaxID=3375152 RepID=UPI0037B24900